jgi:archaellum component FlaC
VTLEEKTKESSKDGENNNINKQLDEKKAELNELDKKVGYVFIEINRI